MRAEPGPAARMRRGDFMSYLRGGGGEVALLTRDYSGDGEHWGEYIFNISVNEALRTRVDAAVSVIEKELRQMIAKNVWSPVNMKGLTNDEKHRIIRSRYVLKGKVPSERRVREIKGETGRRGRPAGQESL